MKKNGIRGRKRTRVLPTGLRLAVEAVGGTTSALAEILQISPQAVTQWKRIPVEHVRKIAKITKIPRAKLRRDIYGR